MERNELIKRDDERVRRPERRSPEIAVLSVVGGIALLGLAALVIVALPDIKRYIKISMM
jgi:hypothetical protein